MGDGELKVRRFTGYSRLYDTHRPRAPSVVPRIAAIYLQARRPGTVVDLGCGTGLSTFLWARIADRVIGVDPSADMLSVARCAPKQARAARL